MGNLSGESREQNRKDKVTRFRSVTYARQLALLVNTLGTGAHQMEPPSPIQALGVNPFPSRFIIRTVLRGDFARRQWEEPITTTK